MKFCSKRVFLGTCLWGAVLGSGALAQQAIYPARPITMIIPLPAGSDTDIVARLVAQSMSAELKQPVVVESRPGAGGQIAMQAVAAARPDGYTIGLTFQAASVIVPQLKSNPPYDPVRDFTNIARVASTSNVLIVRPDSPLKTLQDLVKIAREQPGKLSYGSWGIGSGGHLAGEVMNVDAGIRTQHVPYKGTAEEVRAIVSGEIDYGFVGMGMALSQAKSGQVRVLAVLSPERAPQFLQVPSLKESGFRFAQEGWFGLIAPAGVGPEVRTRLEEVALKAASAAGFVQRASALGMQSAPLGNVEFTNMIKQEHAMWGEWLQRLNWAKE